MVPMLVLMWGVGGGVCNVDIDVYGGAEDGGADYGGGGGGVGDDGDNDGSDLDGGGGGVGSRSGWGK